MTVLEELLSFPWVERRQGSGRRASDRDPGVHAIAAWIDATPRVCPCRMDGCHLCRNEESEAAA